MHSAGAKQDLDGVVVRTEAGRSRLTAPIRAAVAPVRHTIELRR